MSAKDLWIIESRLPNGSLQVRGPQPEEAFGDGAINGMTAADIAEVIFLALPQMPESALSGDNIANWPRSLNPAWVARRRTW